MKVKYLYAVPFMLLPILVTVLLFGSNSIEAKTYKIASSKAPLTPRIERILRKAYGEIGHNIEFVNMPPKRRLVAANSGRVDADLVRVRGIEKEFKNLVRIEEPIYTMTFVAVIHSSNNISISGWDDLKPHKFAYQRGHKFVELKTAGMNRVPVGSAQQILKMVGAGRLPVGVLLLGAARLLIPNIGDIRILEKPLHVVTTYHYVHKKNINIVPLLNNAIKLLRKSNQIN